MTELSVAVLSLTRDRLDYTRHCFKTLRDNAGIAYDHHVFDNGSTDGTQDWLHDELDAGRIASLGISDTNQGIYKPLNTMLSDLAGFYDVVVNVDNDCEVISDGTLRVVAELAAAHPGNVIGPHVAGLRNPPQVASWTVLDDYRVGLTSAIGGIFMPIPSGWRYPEGDTFIHADGLVCAQARREGHVVGQLYDYVVNHYETTDGQHARYPAYFDRRRAEGIPD